MRVARRLAALVLLAPCASWASEALAARVLVLPLEARSGAEGAADAGTARIERALAASPDIAVLASSVVERRLGVDLAEHTRACASDVFCLVEIGELAGADLVLAGKLWREDLGAEATRSVLEVRALDVKRATRVAEISWRWREDLVEIDRAFEAAARRLTGPPDARLRVEVEPRTAKATLNGEPVESGRELPWWSGTYSAELTAPGREPRTMAVVVRPEETYVLRATLPASPVRPERAEAGVGEDLAPAGIGLPDPVVEPVFLQPVPWAVFGLGTGLGVAGTLLMHGAQASYGNLSREARFMPGVTVGARAAAAERDADRGEYRLGSALLGAGVATMAGALGFLVFDALFGAGPEPAP